MALGDRLVVMKDGVVQQCDSPMTVYEKPANRFVAGFIGTPTMNFLPGTLKGSTFSAHDGPHLSLPEGTGQGEGELVLGLRPDSIVPADVGFEATVEVIEHYGDCTDLVLQLGAQKLISRIRGRYEGSEGVAATFNLTPRGLHLFEPGENGQRISTLI
jgi:multiple sugar transport system ATP-binding protein